MLDNSQILLQSKEEIIQAFAAKLRSEVKSAQTLRHPILVNSLPPFLDNLAEAFDPKASREYATESTTIAQEHGGERARLTRYTPDNLIREYQILRDLIFEIMENKTVLSEKERAIIKKSIDRAIVESMASYFLVLTNIREQFIATLTHDLRNPIGVAKMAAEIIQLEVKDPEIFSLTNRIISNMKRADRMIQDLLDTTTVGVGEKLDLKITFCDIGLLMDHIVQQLSAEQRQRIVVEKQSVQCFCDPDAVQRAMENLINNAFKYGGPQSPVTLKYYPLHKKVYFSVHNEGAAIPAEEQEALFQAFRRSSAAKKSGQKGWGIGLALARGVAEAHGGSITVDSSPERGTTFTIDIPQDSRPYQNSLTLR